MSKVGSPVLNTCFAILFLCFPNFLSIHPPTHLSIIYLTIHPTLRLKKNFYVLRTRVP